MKKILALALAAMLLLTMCAAAVAQEAPAATTGKITITNASAGQTYTAYKIFDATYHNVAVAYTTNATIKDLIANGENAPFVVTKTADAEGKYAVQAAEGATGDAVVAWIKANLTSFTSVKSETLTSGNTVEFDVPFGYYYITSSLGTVVTVNTNTPNVQVIDKNQTEPGTPDKTDDEVTAQIGDTVNFTVTFEATNYYKPKDDSSEGTLITEYKVEDTPNGYDIDIASLEVFVNSEKISVSDATIDTAGKLTFTIPWVETVSTGEGEEAGGTVTSKYPSPSTVKFTYSGKVNADASVGFATNKVKVSNNSVQEAFTDTEETKNYKLTINKTDGTTSLSGAEFELYRGDVAEGNKVQLVKLEDGEYRIAESNEAGTTTTIEAGDAVISGFDGDDTYYLKEIKAPDGYNILTDPIEVVFKTTTTEGEETTVTYADVNKEVANQKGTLLPSTGGVGTTLFYVLGGVMVAAAVVLLVTRKRVGSME